MLGLVSFLRTLIWILVLTLLIRSPVSHSISSIEDLKEVGVEEKLGSYIPLNLVFHDENGKEIELKEFFGDGKPVILTLVYYHCPRVCSFILDGVLSAVNNLDSLYPGKDYKILTISFDLSETPEMAREKARKYITKGSKKSWFFLTGSEESIKELTRAIGFNYKKDGDDFAHPSVIIILSPDGKVSRYLYGAQYEPNDLRLALLEAADGKIGSSKLINKVLLFCYQFDPVGKKYALQALNVVKAGGVLTLLLVGMLLTYLWKREKKDPNSNGG
jgi:protein SCO1/2